MSLLLALCMALFGAQAEVTDESALAGDLAGNLSGVSGGTYAPFTDDMFEADLRVGYTAQAGSILNPYFNNENDFISLNQLVFEAMVTLDDQQKPTPQLADTWTHQENVWTFTLRSGVTFHDGSQMTAYDVEASYNQCLKAPETNPYAGRLTRLVESLTVEDEHTVVVTGKYTGYILLYAMNFPIVQSETIAYDLPNGTGPFRYVSYRSSYGIRLEKNDNWWMKESGVRHISFRYYPTAAAEIQGLMTDEIDLMATRSKNAAFSRKLSNVNSVDFATTVYDMLVPNLTSSSFASDKNVRKAIMYAIDRAEITSNIYHDMAIQSEVPVLPGTWLYESQSAQYTYSPERALNLLYENGWRDLTGDTVLNKLNGIRLIELKLTLLTYNDGTNTTRESCANLISDYLAKVGIRAVVEVVSKGRFESRVNRGEYDLALCSMNLSEVPQLYTLLGKGGSANLNKYDNTLLTPMLENTLNEASDEALKQIYSNVQIQIVEELPILGLVFRSGTVLSTHSLSCMTGIRAMAMYRGMEYLFTGDANG